MVSFLPYKTFLKSFKYAPRLAVSLVVENNRGDVLLTRRAIPPGKGKWHMPGGFILKDEPMRACIKRVAKRELGLSVDVRKAEFLGVFENLKSDSRGHIVELIFRLKTGSKITTNSETEEAKFFNKLPAGIGFNHKKTLQELGY